MDDALHEKLIAREAGRREYEKGSKIAFSSGIVSYIVSAEPILSWKALVFIGELFIVPAILLVPLFLFLQGAKGRMKEDSFNRMMALLFLLMLGTCIFAGYLTLRVHQAIFS